MRDCKNAEQAAVFLFDFASSDSFLAGAGLWVEPDLIQQAL
jgi:hypothetical protein